MFTQIIIFDNKQNDRKCIIYNEMNPAETLATHVKTNDSSKQKKITFHQQAQY